jgi:hypothetical protein
VGPSFPFCPFLAASSSVSSRRPPLATISSLYLLYAPAVSLPFPWRVNRWTRRRPGAWRSWWRGSCRRTHERGSTKIPSHTRAGMLSSFPANAASSSGKRRRTRGSRMSCRPELADVVSVPRGDGPCPVATIAYRRRAQPRASSASQPNRSTSILENTVRASTLGALSPDARVLNLAVMA